MDRDLIDPVLSTDPRDMTGHFGFKLATAHFEPGDCIIFGLHLLHSSVPNMSNRFRISIDTRYQLASEASDDRFHGPNGTWQGKFLHRPARRIGKPARCAANGACERQLKIKN